MQNLLAMRSQKLASFNEGKKMLRKLDFEIIEVEE
jgi:hypothetical protein